MNKRLYFFPAIILAVISVASSVFFGITYFQQPPALVQPPMPVSQVATVSTIGISRSEVAGAAMTGALTITWQTKNYAPGAGININLLKKISDSPVSYSLVSRIAINVPNTGSYIWTPKTSPVGKNLLVEVTCANAPQISIGCQTSTQPLSVQ